MLIRLITNYIFFRLRLSRFFYFYHKTHEGWLDTLSSTSSTLASPTSPTVHIHTSAAFNRYWWAHAKVQNFFCYLAGHPQLGLDLMLQAGNYPDVRIAVHEALVCLVLDKCGAEEHDVVKLASEGAPQLV